jgi:hypothetical protein
MSYSGLRTWDPCGLTMRGVSHYVRRSRCRRFPPIILQETKSLASRPFTRRPKSKARRNSKLFLFEEATNSRRKFGSDGYGNPNYGQDAVNFFAYGKSITDKIMAVRLEGLFWARNKVGCSFGFGL